jgi:hypothetical protein
MSKERSIRKRLDDEMYILPVEDDEMGCGKTGGKKYAKGSPEAKAHMARIRSMRGKGKTGGGIVNKYAEYIGTGMCRCGISDCDMSCCGMRGGASEIPYGSIASVLASLVLPIVQHEILNLYAKHRNKKN